MNVIHIVEVSKFLSEDKDLMSCSLVCKSWHNAIVNSDILWYNRAAMRGWYFEKSAKNHKSNYIAQVRIYQKSLFNKVSFIEEILKNPGIPLFKSTIVNSEDENHFFRLVKYLAKTSDNNPILWDLLKRGKNLVNIECGYTFPLFVSVEHSHLLLTQALLNLGADTELRSPSLGVTPIFSARTPELFQILLDCGAKVDACDNKLNNIAHFNNSNLTMLKTLEQFGFLNKFVNSKNRGGETPLLRLLNNMYLSANAETKQALLLLLTNGADPTIKDVTNRNAIDICKSRHISVKRKYLPLLEEFAKNK